MGVSYSFMDNCLYGADDINSVFSKLTTQGVSLFNYSDGDNPLIDLNNAVNNFVETGVEYYNLNACRLVYNAEDSTYKILKGNAFMCDGSIITIDDEGYDITSQIHEIRLLSSQDIYVCFYRNIAENRIDISVIDNDTLYNDKMSLKIGKISESGEIWDARTYAKTKFMPCSANVITEFKLGDYNLSTQMTGEKRLKQTIANIFPGAQYVFFFDQVFPIQRIETTTGDELTYGVYKYAGSNIYAAFNMVGNDLQFWAYVTSSWNSVYNHNCIAF